MKSARCFILAQDQELIKFLRLTLQEYGLQYRSVDNLEMLGPLSIGAVNVAWLIDMDCQEKSVTQISAMARRAAPDAKIVFFSSRFTRELAQECLREQAAALLVKPVQIQRLAQCLGTFVQEPELLDQNEYIPDAESEPEPIPDEPELPARITEDSLFRLSRFKCPFCARVFESFRFNDWMLAPANVESDFCPRYPKQICPELYLISVCPSCFYANQGARFERYFPSLKEKEHFLSPGKMQQRKGVAGSNEFCGTRNFAAGEKSFELACLTGAELRFGDWESLHGELLLKAAWLARRLGEKRSEQSAMLMAVQHYIGLYRPYLRVKGNFPRKSDVQALLPQGKSPLRERTVIVAGFLAAELSRRLGIMEQARFYLDEVSKVPFLTSYPSVLEHVKECARALQLPGVDPMPGRDKGFL